MYRYFEITLTKDTGEVKEYYILSKRPLNWLQNYVESRLKDGISAEIKVNEKYSDLLEKECIPADRLSQYINNAFPKIKQKGVGETKDNPFLKQIDSWKWVLLDLYDNHIDFDYDRNWGYTFLKHFPSDIVKGLQQFGVTKYGTVYYKGVVDKKFITQYILDRIQMLKSLAAL